LFLLIAATPLTLLAVAIDDERRSKEALRVTEERMSLAVESAQLAVWDWDVTNDSIWTTKEGRQFFGFEADEPVQFSNLAGRVHPDDRAVRTTAIRQALDTAGAYEAEYRLILPDGSVRWIAARGRPIPAVNGAPPRIRGVSMDITRQKQAAAEAQLQREELAHLSRVATLSALSGSLAHELRQPLGSILSNAQAGQQFAARTCRISSRFGPSSRTSSARTAAPGEIIERMRTMLRRGEVALQPVHVNESLEELLRLTRSDLIARGVSVSNLATGDLPAAMTDPRAAPAGPPQPDRERVRCHGIESTGRPQPHDHHVSSRRTNCASACWTAASGLPDDAERLFQPFHSTKGGGLGIGLSICRSLVASHGGRLWAEPRADRGAAFYVALLLANEDAAVDERFLRTPQPADAHQRP
jgi:PAS domain S-box-containing protein